MSFFQDYFEYVGKSEAPNIYHRWVAVSIIGALLSRNVYLPFGHGEIYPNQYIMLMGEPGTRKGTAIKPGVKLLKALGYKRFAPDRLSKERFLMEMKPYTEEELDGDLEALVFDAPSEIYAVAEEFTDFVGQGGMEFMTMLTKLWDNMDEYTHPKIHGKSVVVSKPTVNLLGGNTVQGLALAIPPEALGNGFMSRMIFVQSEPTGTKITFPMPPRKELVEGLVNQLKQMKDLKGGMSINKEDNSLALLDRIYNEYTDVEDPRFKHYGTRRFTHLLKLCIIFAASDLRTVIEADDVLNANTLLHYTELRMPKALGEFGKSKFSDVANTIINYLNGVTKPATANEIFKLVAKDITDMRDVAVILKNLTAAEKIQVTTVLGKQGYMLYHGEKLRWSPELLNESFLTEEELI